MRFAVCVCVLSIFIFSSSLLGDSLPIVNGSFETGTLTGWTTLGDVAVLTSAIGDAPTQGTYQAIVSTAPSSVPGTVCCNFPFSGTPAVIGGPGFPDVSAQQLFSFISTQFNTTPGQGSLLSQTFTANAGDVLQFDWNFLTTDFASDFAIVDVDGVLFSLKPRSVGISNTVFGSEGGYMSFSTVLSKNGAHYVGIAAFDGFGDTFYDSALLVDNVRVSAPVPEPSTWLLMGSGLIGIGLVGIRHRRAQLRPAVTDVK